MQSTNQAGGRPAQSGYPGNLNGGLRRVSCFIALLAADAMGIVPAQLVHARGGSGVVARARQVAMYLMHTTLSVKHHDIAAAFERDRSTVAHACRAVEDLRDDPRIDKRILAVETTLAPIVPLLRAELSR